MNQNIELNSNEISALHGLPYVAQLSYIQLKTQMDNNGLIGAEGPIRWTELSRALWVKPRQGERNSGTPNPNSLRVRVIQQLVSNGLISIIKTEKNEKTLRCVLDSGCAKTQARKKVSLKKPPQIKLVTEIHYEVAQKLLDIKQRHFPNACPNMDVWAKDVRDLQESVLIPNKTGLDSHKITTDEIIQAFEFVYTNKFWADKITTPKQLCNYLSISKTKKASFRTDFLAYIENEGENAKHVENRNGSERHKKPPPNEEIQESLRQTFREHGITY